ncbi:hypothetical protein KGF56_002633 [Candida oxycetoniae]|uniref:STAS domain-containing protein n=1 Tax=Candida oxycetoniae TaxID=497107 RepID=A0AAI9SWS0_9ASCO|nr:uncharacterized protein KGF56_002633 [Candida oxycetoniae]KAI3404534.2 hypothetical protein KGF56_002633 [Candida oxycetoniae]
MTLRPGLQASPRITSPTPSIRPISRKRVNVTERSGLLNKLDSDPDETDDEQCSINYRQYTPIAKNDLGWSELLPYYLPCLSWIGKYNFRYFVGDLIGGLTLVFFQLPLSLSYASTLAHVPVISGLYSLALSPLIYLIFGSVPQMVVGPEGPISLIVGQAVEPLLHHAKKKNLDPLEYVATITFISGTTLLGFGLGRFGFLDNVLSPSLLKGFISAVGFVMILNSLIVVLGLEELMKKISDDPSEMDIHSPFDKMVFLVKNINQYNHLSLKIGAVGFAIIMVTRFLKKRSRNKTLVFIPEILLVVGGATILCQYYQWDLQGIDVIGKIKDSGNFTMYNPIGSWKLVKKFGTSGFLCAVLGFFESTTASKSLGSSFDLPISSNRELVALGSINIIGSIFGALPAFGGYGRSKINAISAKTTMSGAIMGAMTLFTISFLLRFLFYVPMCMLSVVIAVIGISLIEEAPYEVAFHWRTGGYDELITFTVTVLTTLFFSIEVGIAMGLVYSLIRVIKNSADSRIQILGRIPNSNMFVNADIPMRPRIGSQVNIFNDLRQMQLNSEVIEEVEGCLIIKIPEPLSFTNCSDLVTRLKRVEMYGSTKAHPASKRSRGLEMTKYVIFDLAMMNSVDSSAAKTLYELLTNYRSRGTGLYFVNVSLNVRKTLQQAGIRNLLMDDLVDLKYFDIQDLATTSEDEVICRCKDLIDNGEPYFQHISDVLKLIDCYETILGEV